MTAPARPSNAALALKVHRHAAGLAAALTALGRGRLVVEFHWQPEIWNGVPCHDLPPDETDGINQDSAGQSPVAP